METVCIKNNENLCLPAFFLLPSLIKKYFWGPYSGPATMTLALVELLTYWGRHEKL